MQPISGAQLLQAGKNSRFFLEFGNVPMGICSFAQISDRLLQCRAMGRLPAHAQGVILFLFPYRVDGRGNVSRYAAVPDYHTVVTPALEQLAKDWEGKFPPYSFRAFCDNSPVPEVRAAALSGLGVMGENGLLIHPEYGSWVFIGELVTDAPVLPTGDTVNSCLQCGLCRRLCPGQALSTLSLEKDRCLSHVSQKKGELTQSETDLLLKGGSAWGCDACQECCPMNSKTKITGIERFSTDFRPVVEKGDVLRLPDRAYSWRGPKVIERNLDLLGSCCSPEKP